MLFVITRHLVLYNAYKSQPKPNISVKYQYNMHFVPIIIVMMVVIMMRMMIISDFSSVSYELDCFLLDKNEGKQRKTGET